MSTRKGTFEKFRFFFYVQIIIEVFTNIKLHIPLAIQYPYKNFHTDLFITLGVIANTDQ